MTAALALFIKFLPQLFQATQSVPTIINFINDTKANFQARNEWTREADEAFTQELANWKPQI